VRKGFRRVGGDFHAADGVRIGLVTDAMTVVILVSMLMLPARHPILKGLL